MEVLALKNVSVRFKSRGLLVEALHDATLSVREHEFVTLVGPSGCGKSTVLNLMAGLLPPTSGQVDFRGNAIEGPNQQIGYVTQRDTLLPWRTLEDNVAFPLEVRGIARDSRMTKALELIEMVGLGGFERHYPHELSGGMRQRAMIIRSLIYEPEVLLFDEPFGALDAQTRGYLQNELIDLQLATRKTMVFVTHDLIEALALADRIIVVSRAPGTIKAEHKVPFDRPRNVFQINNAPGFHELHESVKAELMTEMANSRGS